MAAVNQICSERGIEPKVVIETLQKAIHAAYRKDYEDHEDVEVQISKKTGAVRILEEGKDITPPGFGRIAAQTAKQVILQGVREAEKDAIINEYQDKVGTIVSGMLQRREGQDWIVGLGRTTGTLPREEQIHYEDYRNNQRLFFYIKEISEQHHKTQIVLSRSHQELLCGLFKQEIPEIANKAIEIKAVAREPGHRSKVAVASTQDGVDAVGSCVGQRGIRIQAVTDELNGERIDVILWNEAPEKFISAALSPADVTNIKINEKEGTAYVQVPDDQISLAIGKKGQNARLAAKLTGWRIDIHGEKESLELSPAAEEGLEEKVPANILTRLEKAETSWEEATKMSSEELSALKGVGAKTVEKIREIIENSIPNEVKEGE